MRLRRFTRFSLRTLLVFMTLAGVAISILGPRLQQRATMTRNVWSAGLLPVHRDAGAPSHLPSDRFTQTAVREWLEKQGFERDRSHPVGKVEWFTSTHESRDALQVRVEHDAGGAFGKLTIDVQWQQPYWLWERRPDPAPAPQIQRFCRKCDRWLDRYHTMETIMRRQSGFSRQNNPFSCYDTGPGPEWERGFRQ